MSNTLPLETITLVQILAPVDSLFGEWPDPKRNNAACSEVHTRQVEYLAGRGIPWRVGGTVEQRKEGEQVLGVLETEGLVTTHKVARSHRHVALTDRGDDRARSLLEFHRVRDSWPLLAALAQSVERGPGRWTTVANVAEDVGGCEEKGWAWLAPLLARGHIEATVGTRGQTLFTVRPDQWGVAAGDPPALLADPPPDARCNPVFWRAYADAEAEKPGWKPRRPNSVYVRTLN